jgi:hypothetical protein
VRSSLDVVAMLCRTSQQFRQEYLVLKYSS